MKNILILSLFFTQLIFAQTTRTWTGLGANNNWSTAANWSGSVVPTSVDTVVFNSTSVKNCILNNPATISVGKFVIESGYSGTITQNTNRNIVVSTDFIMDGGTIIPTTGISNGNYTISGSFIISGGSFTKSTGSMTIQNGSFIQNSGTFNKGTGGNMSVTLGEFELNDGIFDMGTSGNLTVSTGNLTINGGEFKKASIGNVIVSSGSLAVYGGSFISTGAGGTINVSNAALEIFDGVFKTNAETINATNASIYIENGIFESVNGTITNGDIYLNGGNMILNSSSFNPVFFEQNAGVFFGGSGKHTYGSGGVYLLGGTYNFTTDSTFLRDNIEVSGGTTFHHNGTVVFNISSSTLEVQGLSSVYNLVVQNLGTGATSRTLNLNSDINVLNELRLVKGSGASSARRIVINGSTIILNGNLIVAGNSTSNFTTSGNSTIIMSSSTPKNITAGSSLSRSRFISNIEIASPSQVTISGKLAISTSLNVNAGASLTFSTDTVLIHGNLTVDGTINHNNGTVTFFKQANNTVNEIGGSALIPFNNIYIWRTNTFGNSYVDQFADITLAGSMDFSNTGARFRTNDNSFTILSTASGTGRIGIITNTLQFQGGPITIQRYIPGSAGRFWYQIGAPLSNVPMSNIKATYTDPSAQDPDLGIFINGSAIANVSPAVPSLGITNGATPSVFQFNPSSTNPWIAPTDVNANMSNLYGYRFFIRDGSATIAPSTGAKLLSFTGDLRKLTQTIPLTYQANGGTPIPDGWVVLANPFPSDITGNLNKSGAFSHTGLSLTSVYVWDAPSANWRVRTPTDSAQFVNIPSSKAFMIRVSPSNGSIQINEAAKTKTNTSFSKEEPIVANYVPIKLLNNTTGIFDITSIKYDSTSTVGFDSDMDAYKLTLNGGNSASITIHSYIDDLPASINNKPGFDIMGDTTQLFINCQNGLNTLSFLQPEILPDTVEALLIDKFTSNVISIKDNPVYEFQVTSDTLSKFKRFMIVYKGKEKVTSIRDNTQENKISIYPNPNFSGVFYIKNNKQNIPSVELFNAVGERIAVILKNQSENSYTLPTNVNSGLYFVKIKSDQSTFTEKLIVQ